MEIGFELATPGTYHQGHVDIPATEAIETGLIRKLVIHHVRAPNLLRKLFIIHLGVTGHF